MIAYLQPVVVLALAVLVVGLWARLRHLEHKIEHLEDWLHHDIARIERLETRTPSIKEEEWLPPVSPKHKR